MKTIIRNVNLVNEGTQMRVDILIDKGVFEKISSQAITVQNAKEINGENLMALPGLIDDQVHFREPGLTHKGEIYTEAKAAVAGGITSYMEMPNTNPPAVTIDKLEEKYSRAAQCSLANYSFFMGTTNHNYEELVKVDSKKVCGIKIFMGSSTGDMLVDNEKELNKIFSNIDKIIATHCEYDPLIKANHEKAFAQYGENIPIWEHPNIRSREACYRSSSFAVDLAKKTGARLHILHISTAEELALFDNRIPLQDKKITAEACTHHLWFSEEDYADKGTWIKWNPAVKKVSDRNALWEAVNNGKIDVLATDHAPHTLEEKDNLYAKAPSGGPLVQHNLQALLAKEKEGIISMEQLVQLSSHNVATLFGIENRGFVREGYAADLVLVDRNAPQTINKSNILYKCGWSPFEGTTFDSSIHATFVNGNLVYNQGVFNENNLGMRMTFNR
jgi:dihydroorotase